MSPHEALKRLYEEGPEDKSLGICSLLPCEYESALKALFPRWPEYSGNITFPVPHPELSPRDAYLFLYDIWNRDTEYGKARWRLLEWLIKETAE